MANTVSLLSYANTFGDWVVTTNALTRENNTLAANNYIKSTGTLYLSDPSLGLQVAQGAIFGGQLQVQGIGSSAYIQNNLRVDTQVYFQNTTLGLTNSGELISYGRISASGPSIGLAVANNTTIGGYLRVTGNTNISNTLTVSGTTTISNNAFISGNAQITGNVIAQNYVNVTNDVNATNFNATNNFNGYNLAITNDGSINKVLTVGNNATIGGQTTLVGNVTAANNLTVSARTQTNALLANVINSTGTTYTNALNSNNTINTTTLNASGTAYVNSLSSNGTISGTDLSLSGTTLNATGVAGNFQALTTTGSVTVGGNFILTGQTVYATNTFTLSAGVGSPISSYFSVYRSGGANANASIRWNENQQYFDLNNVNNGNYYRIHTDEFSSDSTTNYGSKNIATSNAVYYLQTVANTTNTSLAYISGVANTQNTLIGLAWIRANSSAQLFNGTTGSASPTTPGGVVTLTSTNGITVTGSSNTLTINSPQDLRTTATPTFTGLTLSTNPLAISSGGTGATSAGAALTALLPAGTTAGYVLTTGGPGSFSWSPGGSGGGGGATPGTTINSTRTSYVGNSVTTVYTTPVYVAGTNQVRVYFDGVRQHPSEYTETSGNTGGSGIVTFTSSPPTGSAILFEVDGYIINPYYANNITYTAPQGGITSSANTIQLAINDLETRKAALSGASFTGPVQAPTALISTANTQVATTSWVSTFANSSLTFASNITGTAPAGSLTGSTLNSGVTASSLTSVGTINSGTWSGSFGAVSGANLTGLTAGNLSGTIPSAVLGNSTHYVGTTAIALNRASASQALTGITSIDGSAATLTTARAIYGNNFDGSAALTGAIAATYGGTGVAGTLTGVLYGNATSPQTVATAAQLVSAIGSTAVTNATSATSAGTFTSTSQNSQFNSIGIGTAASAIAGEIRATNNITAYYSSDKKFKENIEDIPNALDAVDAIGGKLFDWTDAYLEAHGGEDSYFNQKQDFGVIAQDVQSVFPRAIRTREDGSLAVDYEKLVALSFAAIKELKQEIDTLKGSK